MQKAAICELKIAILQKNRKKRRKLLKNEKKYTTIRSKEKELGKEILLKVVKRKKKQA